MKYVIGIDGGGTKTILKIADLNGNLLAQCQGGPSNINAVGMQYIEDMLKALINEGLSKINGCLEDCCMLCIGTAGAGRPEDKKIMEGLIRKAGYGGKLIVTSDAAIALYGGVGGGEGIIIISGTGSICYGRKKNGEVFRAGGWGHIIGDEGSGYDIGVRALRHIMRSFDGREEGTLLTPMVLDYLKIKSPEGLIEYIYRSGVGKKDIADIAKVVDKAYLAGDCTAGKILNDAAHELYLCCSTVIKKLGFEDMFVTAAFSGSVLMKNKYIFNELSYLLHESYPKINVTAMKNDAAWGAVMIALEEIKNME